jgi:cysteine-rich repeat protein
LSLLSSFRLGVVVAATLTSSGCHLLLGSPIACVGADEATCPTDQHCAAGECVDGAPRCGDGDLTGNEVCDDGNTSNDDDCTNACTANTASTATCGNGVTEAPEACDDGNDNNNDACTTKCAPPRCGDGVLFLTEACDDGNADEDDGCTTLCGPPLCGDSITSGEEECDDGNADEEDGCTTACAPPRCGDGITSAPEACDDGNLEDDDDCTTVCAVGLIASSCSQLHASVPTATTGTYIIDVDGDGDLPAVPVHCDMDFDGGGWTRVLLTDTTLAIAALPEDDTSGAGRLSTAYVAALARLSAQIHIRTAGDEDRSATSVPGALPIQRLRAAASLSPVEAIYTLTEVQRDWTGPFNGRLAHAQVPTHNVWPDVYETGDNVSGLQLFDDGTQLVSRWGGAENEAIEIWLRSADMCGDGDVQGAETCDDGNAIDADGCSRCVEDVCGDGAGTATLATVGVRTMVHTADLDSDGFDDVIVVELASNTPTVSVARGSPDGLQPAVPMVLADMPDNLSDMPVAQIGGVGGSEIVDVDNDGALDLALFDHFNCTFQIFRGNGAGAFAASTAVSPATPFDSTGGSVCGEFTPGPDGRRTHLGAFFDVNLDGRLDVVLPSSLGHLWVALQGATGQFSVNAETAPVAMPARYIPNQVIAADVGDGPALVVACHKSFPEDTTERLVVLRPDGLGGFDTHEVTPDVALNDLVVVDMNDDGLPDLVGTGPAPVTRVLVNDQDFSFVTAGSFANGGRIAASKDGRQLGIGVAGGADAFLRVVVGSGGASLTPSASGPAVTDYAAPGFVDADGVAGDEYISAADNTVFVARSNTCTLNP